MNFIYFMPLLAIVFCNYSITINESLLNPNYSKQDTIKTMRIEYYSEIDKGNPNAGAGKMINPDGSVFYMGKADYQPYIKRCVYELNELEAAKLLESKLVFLPYFRETKKDITLGQYFEAIQAKEKIRSLFPKNLDGYYKHAKEDRAYFDTFLSSDLRVAGGFFVIRLNDDIYYLDKAYYRLEWEKPEELFTSNCEDTYREGRLYEFIGRSPLVQSKIEEGKPDPVFNYKEEDMVASILTSPCAGICEVYRLEIYGSGRMVYTGYSGLEPLGKHETKTSSAKIKLLLKRALSVNYAAYFEAANLEPRPFTPDEQSIITNIWSLDGQLQELISPSRTPQELSDFYNFFVQLFEDEIKALKK